MALQRLAKDGLGWAPTCCNLVTLLCFGLCLALNEKVSSGMCPHWQPGRACGTQHCCTHVCTFMGEADEPHRANVWAVPACAPCTPSQT
jgi:hypothetical protein